jgi:hypothetical protein
VKITEARSNSLLGEFVGLSAIEGQNWTLSRQEKLNNDERKLA